MELLLSLALTGLPPLPVPSPPDPSGPPTPPYLVRVNGAPVAVHQAHTWEPGYVPSYGGPYWFCSFDLAGRIANVVFRNVSFAGGDGKPPGRIRVHGPDGAHPVVNVRFENVTRDGLPVTADSPGVEVGGAASNILFLPKLR